MKTLLERLKDKEPLTQNAIEYPTLNELLIKELSNNKFVGDITISITIDLMSIYNISHIADVYDLFNKQEL